MVFNTDADIFILLERVGGRPTVAVDPRSPVDQGNTGSPHGDPVATQTPRDWLNTANGSTAPAIASSGLSRDLHSSDRSLPAARGSVPPIRGQLHAQPPPSLQTRQAAPVQLAD